ARRGGQRLGLGLDQLAVAVIIVLSGLLGLAFLVLGIVLVVDDVDAHFVEHRVDVLDLVGRYLLRRQHRVELVVGDVASLLGELDHLLDRRIRQVEQRQRAVWGLGGVLVGRGSSLRLLGLGLGRDGNLGCHSLLLTYFRRFDFGLALELRLLLSLGFGL